MDNNSSAKGQLIFASCEPSSSAIWSIDGAGTRVQSATFRNQCCKRQRIQRHAGGKRHKVRRSLAESFAIELKCCQHACNDSKDKCIVVITYKQRVDKCTVVFVYAHKVHLKTYIVYSSPFATKTTRTAILRTVVTDTDSEETKLTMYIGHVSDTDASTHAHHETKMDQHGPISP